MKTHLQVNLFYERLTGNMTVTTFFKGLTLDRELYTRNLHYRDTYHDGQTGEHSEVSIRTLVISPKVKIVSSSTIFHVL